MRLPAAFTDASISRKLTFIALGATGAAMLFAMLVLTAQQWFHLRNELAKNVYTQASIVAANSASSMIFNDREAAEQTLGALATVDNIEFAGLLDKAGKDFAAYVRTGMVIPPHLHTIADEHSYLHAMTYIEVVVPVTLKQERIGTIHMRSSMSPVYKELAWSVLMFVVAAVGAMLIAGILLMRLLPTIIDPVQYLVGLMNTVSREQNYILRAESHSKDEIGRLAQGFNGMLEGIQTRDAELVQYRNHLETQVAQRTSALREANQLLENELHERKIAEQALHDSEERFRKAFQNSAIGMALVGLDGRWLKVNNALCNIVGYSEQELLSKTFQDITHPDDLKTDIDFIAQLLAGEIDHYQMEKRYLHMDGHDVWIHLSVSLIRDEQNNPIHFVSQIEDITERKKVETELRISATAFESQEGMLITDAHGATLRVNNSFTNITGYTAAEVIGKNPRLLGSGRHDADFFSAMWKSIQTTGTWEGEIFNRRKNGEVFPAYLNITAVKDKNGVVSNYVSTLTDITLKSEAAEKIKHLAFYDPLTGLPNRRLLIDRLHQAFAFSARSGHESALLFIDLDNFKDINDTLGHDSGDLLLQQAAQRLKSCMRDSDTVARMGGDEFVVMLEELSGKPIEAATQTKVVGEKILAALKQPYHLAAKEYKCTASIGATLFSDHHQSAEELLKRADIAMYQAKKAGRNTMRFFNSKMQEVINTRSALENQLRTALVNRQFHLYYQIQMDSSHHAVGAEALIRWIHPELGLVSPDQFIHLAEESGLIIEIGQWVLETACAQLKAWEQNALTRDLILSVNVSAKQFHQADFVAQMRSLVQRHAINPTQLKLEITESMLLENVVEIIATMNALKEIGVTFSLDDFGTGYSSLQYLKRLPLDQLKIDQSFVRDIAIDNNDKTIVQTIIAMAQSLNLNVIAEGVETEEQRSLLLERGCTHYQGYLFSKPVPIEQFEALLKRG